MVPRLKILISSGPKRGTRIYYPFLSKSPSKQIPSRFPNGAPRERDTHLRGILHLSLYIPLIVFLSQSPVRGPPPCSLTGSPRTGILCHQSHWPSKRILFINHSFISICQSPQKGALLNTYRKNTRSLPTEPNMDRRPTYNGVWPGSPRGSFKTLSLHPGHAALGTIPSTFAFCLGRPEAVSQCIVVTPIRVYPSEMLPPPK